MNESALNSQAEQMAWLLDEGRRLLSPETDEATADAAVRHAWQREMLRQQREFRHRSRYRFPDPASWIWTERSLAQASDWWSASMKAKLFPADELVVDACCGAGVDAVALCNRGEVLAIDRDPLMTRLATSNVAAHGGELRGCNGSFDLSFVQQLPEACRWLHIDPDRRASPNRAADRRTTQADEFSPSLDEILVAAARFAGAAVKLAPSTRMAETVEAHLENQANRLWLGNMGECRQQLLLLGELATVDRGIRQAVLAEPTRATQGGDDGEGLPTFAGAVVRFPACLSEPAAYLYDLHPVLHAAELQTAWGEAHGLRPLGGEHGYFSGPSRIDSPWAQCFEIKAVLAWDDRKVRRWLRAADAGTVEVKNRLVRMDANAAQRRYSGSGTAALTLLVTQIGDRVRAIAAQRL